MTELPQPGACAWCVTGDYDKCVQMRGDRLLGCTTIHCTICAADLGRADHTQGCPDRGSFNNQL